MLGAKQENYCHQESGWHTYWGKSILREGIREDFYGLDAHFSEIVKYLMSLG